MKYSTKSHTFRGMSAHVINHLLHTLLMAPALISLSHASRSHSRMIHTTATVSTSGTAHDFQSSPPPTRQPSAALGAESEAAIRLMCQSSSPIRPIASNPPSPQPESATSIAETYQLDLTEHPAKRSTDVGRTLLEKVGSPSRAPVSRIALPQEEFPVKLPRLGKDVEIKHPSPRRLGSHPVLLHRTSSMAASIGQRSVSDSPGPPPPNSPLRIGRDPKSIEGLISSSRDLRRATPKIAPSIRSISEHASDVDSPIIIPTVITECTGPIKRPKSRERKPVKHPLYPMSRKEREEHTRRLKIRDRPGFSRTIDAVVNAQTLPARRLRKARPHIQIPDVKPAPLATRASSSASSNASWKKVTENTLSPVSTVPSQDEKSSEEGKTGYTPNSPTPSNSSPNSANMALSPVMLVAEEVPLPKSRSTPKPTRLILRGEGSKYAPRPRSASIPRTKRRSRGSISATSRPNTPENNRPRGKKDNTPPLPSPPPNRALPPTPPASGSEVIRRTKPTSKRPSPTDTKSKDLPFPPHENLSPAPLQPRHHNNKHHPSTSLAKPLPHITTQDLRTAPTATTTTTTPSSSSSTAPTARATAAARIDARLERLEALEKQNALLNAALMAVLRTNGALNTSGPFAAGLGDALESGGGPMAWENRVARRSTAQGRHAASSSGGSAGLDLYMSSRGRGVEG